MNLVINFNDWRISTSAHDLHEAENLSKRVDVVGEMPAEYLTYMLHVRVRGYEFDPILLTATERGVGAILTSNMLAYGGEKYEFQVWGINGEKTRATNLISILLPESITGDEEWAEIPSAFTQIENRIADMNAHPPVPDADTKKWMLWDPEESEYQISDLDVPEAEDGRGIESTSINSNQHLIITYTDGTTVDAGSVGEGAGITIDPTLSIEGAAADAKVVGEEVDRLNDTLNEISVCIPSQASYSNQLADKAFVNSSIGTNTAYYISNNGQPFTSLAQLEAYSGTVTNNDYAFVVGTDSAGNTTYTRYKYNESTHTWSAEFVLNNSSFTAAQWAAIESGITAALVAIYNAHLADEDIHVSAANKTAWNGKLDKSGGTMTGDIRMGATAATRRKITMLADPTSDHDAATKKYVDEHSGGADNTFVVTGGYDGSALAAFDKTFAEILAAHESKKVVMLYLATDDVTLSYTMPLICYYDDEMIFGCPDKLDYSGGNHSNIYVHVSRADVWSISYDDYAPKRDLDDYVAKSQGVAHAGKFLVVGDDGNVTTMALSVWQGGSY